MRLLKTLALSALLAAIPWLALAAEAEEHSEGGIPRALLYAGINFLILVGILVYFLKKPTQEFFASRSTLIRTQLTQAKDLKTSAEHRFAEYEKRLQHVQQERQKLIDELKRDGELERQRIIQSGRDQVTAMQLTSEKVVAQELRKAKEELKREAVNLATELAEKLLREHITAQDQSRLVEDYLQKMESLT